MVTELEQMAPMEHTVWLLSSKPTQQRQLVNPVSSLYGGDMKNFLKSELRAWWEAIKSNFVHKDISPTGDTYTYRNTNSYGVTVQAILKKR